MNPGGTAPAAPRCTAAEGGRGRGGRGGGGGRNWSVTPLVIKGVMYLTTAYNRVVALEPETAKEIWVYEVKDGAPAVRGLEFWAGDKDSPATIFFGTSSGKLFALNAKTGKPISRLWQRRRCGHEARRAQRPGKRQFRPLVTAHRI